MYRFRGCRPRGGRGLRYGLSISLQSVRIDIPVRCQRSPSRVSLPEAKGYHMYPEAKVRDAYLVRCGRSPEHVRSVESERNIRRHIEAMRWGRGIMAGGRVYRHIVTEWSRKIEAKGVCRRSPGLPVEELPTTWLRDRDSTAAAVSNHPVVRTPPDSNESDPGGAIGRSSNSVREAEAMLGRERRDN